MTLQLIRLIRPLQWLKNVFVFLPMFFSRQAGDLLCWQEALVCFFSFSFAASAIYCLNDTVDAENDSKHPVKRHRPIASGAISKPTGLLLFLLLGGLSVAMTLLLEPAVRLNSTVIILIYLGLNVAYCLWLKNVAIVDVLIVSVGYVLRVFMGGVSSQIWVSPWIVLLTFLLALFLAVAKRRDDVILLMKDGVERRTNIRNYNLEFLNQTLSITGGVTIVSYLMYCLSPEVIQRYKTEYLYITAFFVIAGILRYLQITLVQQRSGNPTKILVADRFLHLTILGWVLTFVILLYL